MNISIITKHFQSLGLEVRGRLIYGIYKNYPLFMQMQGNRSAVNSILVRLHLAETMPKKFRKEFKNLLKKRCGIVFTGQTLQLTLRTQKENALMECDGILNTMTEYLSNHQMYVSEQCPICGLSQCDSAVFYNGAYQKVHSNCISAAMEHITNKADQNQINGHYLLGILGAILGGLVGIIPNLLTIWFTETIYSLLYALIPICIYWGYRLFKGVMNKSAIIVTIVLSILYLFIMEFILLVLSVYIETNGLILIRECWDVFTDPMIFREILSDMSSSFIFLILGLIYSWRMISETNTHVHSNAEFTMSTLTPLIKPVSEDAPQATPSSVEDSTV